MRITFVLTDDGGRRFEGTAELKPAEAARKDSSRSRSQPSTPRSTRLSFDLNPRAFMKKHAEGMRGDQKFTLLLARLSKGDTSKHVTLGEIESHWNRMKPVMGGKFNGAHSNRAKEKGWVDAPKRGEYVLSSSWKDALLNEPE